MPSTVCEGGNMTVLFKMVSSMIAAANIVTIHRKYFNEAKGIYISCKFSRAEVLCWSSRKYSSLTTPLFLHVYSVVSLHNSGEMPFMEGTS